MDIIKAEEGSASITLDPSKLDARILYMPNAKPVELVVEAKGPMTFRMARKPNGELVLQGLYVWQNWSNNSNGGEWRDEVITDLTEEEASQGKAVWKR